MKILPFLVYNGEVERRKRKGFARRGVGGGVVGLLGVGGRVGAGLGWSL